MSLYRKTHNEIAEYLQEKYKVSDEIKNNIINQYIDGAVLFELKDKDFKNLNLSPFAINSIKFKIDEERNSFAFKELTEDELFQKLILLGINEPSYFVFSDDNENILNIGSKTLLDKYSKKLLNIINKNSSSKDILDFFGKKLKMSQESLNNLDGIFYDYLYEIKEKEINYLKIRDEDKTKLKRFIVHLKKNKENIEKIKTTFEQNEKIKDKEILEIEMKIKLEEMIIAEYNGKAITMDLLYKKLNDEKKMIILKNSQKKLDKLNPYFLELEKDLSVKIFNIEGSLYFDFLVENLYAKDIFFNPMKTKMKIENELMDIHIISNNQINYFTKKYKILKPFLKCNSCGVKNHLITFFFFSHVNFNDTLIYDLSNRLEFKNEEELRNYFPKSDIKKFSTPIIFERNFNKYFNRKNFIKTAKEFIYYDDIGDRINISSNIIRCNYFGKYLIFFGFRGIGKSITVNYTLKYKIDHTKFKTFYIHCKYLFLLSKENNYIEIQNILLSEIPYLFYNDYESYIKCSNIIKEFDFSFNKSYIDLIESIINYFITKKDNKYLIVFDQYNMNTDPDGKIKNIINNILKNRIISKKFTFYSFMSLNNKDVKKYKIDKLLNINRNENITVIEIENIIYDGKFSNTKFQEIYEKLGKTIKNYSELKQQKEKELEEYYNKKKGIIKSKIIQYYNNSKIEKDDLSFFGMTNLIKFSVGILYKEDEIKELSKYINFKYFDVRRDNECFEIFYLFPVVEEVLKEIYYSFIFDNPGVYSKLLDYNLIKGGGKGYFYEQIVINSLSPIQSNIDKKHDIIPDLIIEEKECIPKFLPESNEVQISFMDNKINIEKNKTYLIEQKIFGGKSIDFIIIESHENDQSIFAFQVSILKDKIFTEDEIKKILIEMVQYIQNFIENLKVDKDNIYFGYIFSLINKDMPEFKKMINDCQTNGVAFSYYCYDQNKLLKSNLYPITSIYDIVKNPFGIKPILTLNNNYFGNKRKREIIYKRHFQIEKNEINQIINLLKKIYHKDIEEIEFRQNTSRNSLYTKMYDFLYTRDKNKISLVIIKIFDFWDVYNLDNVKKYDVEKYLENKDVIFDCYSIYFKGQKKEKIEKKSPIDTPSDEEDDKIRKRKRRDRKYNSYK